MLNEVNRCIEKIEYIEKINKDHLRPQMARENILLLDGEWECNGCKIKVPYPPESELSGYDKRKELLACYKNNARALESSPEKFKDFGHFIYLYTFQIPDNFNLPRFLLHFDAVDQIADVYVNDQFVGHHEGGYLPFYFDITDYAIDKDAISLRVEVTDHLSHFYPYGKQRYDRGGMWYTPVSGIWKSVWIENVSEIYVKELQMLPSLDQIVITAFTSDGKKHQMTEKISNPKLWTPDQPNLYPIRITIGEDVFDSYFALRTISISKNTPKRVLLNGKPIFLNGVLDQGYYQDGIYRPKEMSAYDEDIKAMKSMGFNMLRKHCKVEPEYFYTACDIQGMLVFQDMVENGSYHLLRDTLLPTVGIRKLDDRKYKIGRGKHAEEGSVWTDKYDDDKRRDFFIIHSIETQHVLFNHPSIIAYTIFNEGWGQFDSARVYGILKSEDRSRLYDSASGWYESTRSDFDSDHIYFRNKKITPGIRPFFLSECAGYSLPIEGHMYNSGVYGYGSVCKSKEEFTDRIITMYEEMILPVIENGMAGCVFTQLSDVEDEVNGLITYDRQVIKADVNRLKKEAEKIDRIIQNLDKTADSKIE